MLHQIQVKNVAIFVLRPTGSDFIDLALGSGLA